MHADHDSAFDNPEGHLKHEGTYGETHRANGTARSVEKSKGKERGPSHPATGNKEYTAAEMEVLREYEKYKAETGQKFPPVTAVVAIMIERLGYRQVAAVESN